MGFPIQISPDHWICAPPRSFSQLITSSSALSAKHPPYALSSMTNLLSFTGMNDRYTDIALSAFGLRSILFTSVFFRQ